jgi:Uma2 family endonuclease
MSIAMPLSEERVAYPALPDTSRLPVDDGEPMESAHHRKQMNLLCELFERALPRETTYVAGNMGLYYSARQLRSNDFKAPDVFVVLDAVGSHDRKAWVVWEEDGRTPNLVIELLSDSTERNDRREKMRTYEEVLKVANYMIFDPWDFRFEAWRLIEGRYEPKLPDASGRILWPETNLTLGRWHGSYHDGPPHTWLRVFDAEGRLVLTGDELAEAEAQRAEAEAQRAEAEAQRAEAEAQRAEAEAQRAEAEAQRANMAEARVRELLAELARRGG